MSYRIGSRGPEVSRIQQSLQQHGQHLAVDGRYGRETRAAVREFQRSHHLRPDGIVGRRTAAALGLHGDGFDAAPPRRPGAASTPGSTSTSAPRLGGPPPVRPPPAELSATDRLASFNDQMADRLQWYRENGVAVPPTELAAARRLDETTRSLTLPLVQDDGAMNRLSVASGRLHSELERVR